MSGLLLSYFRTDDESLYLAFSVDGRRFEQLRGGKPVLGSPIGSRRMRDPFIGVGPDGEYRLIATDGWASRSIFTASSRDLLDWSDIRLVPVMDGIPGAHNAWAPEFFRDAGDGLFRLIWSSAVDGAIPSDWDWSTRTQEHRIWQSATRDFRAFSVSEIFFDPGYSVIDATVAHGSEGYLMAFKDERESDGSKVIRVTGFRAPGAGFNTPSEGISPARSEGPTIFRRDDEWVMLFDRYADDGYDSLASTDGRSWVASDVVLPEGVRHASVLELDAPPAWIQRELDARETTPQSH